MQGHHRAGATGKSMAEGPTRYCGNCGNELTPNDRLCQSCGTPVHQAATVPTPEADVPVPAPPLAGGAAPQPQQVGGAQQQSWPRRHPLLTGGLGLVGVFFLLIIALVAAVGGGGGGGEVAEEEPRAATPADDQKKEPKPEKEEPEFKVGQTVGRKNIRWQVWDAYLTNQLNSSIGTPKQGRFVVIDFTFTNNRNEEITIDPELHMVLKDSQGREVGDRIDALEYMPTNQIFREPVNLGISKDGRVIYRVADDATGFTLSLADFDPMEDKWAVFDLGVLPERAYADPPADATATASPGPSSGASSDHVVTCDELIWAKLGECTSPSTGDDWIECRAPSREAVTETQSCRGEEYHEVTDSVSPESYPLD